MVTGLLLKPQTPLEAVKEMPGLLTHLQPSDLKSDDGISQKVIELWADGKIKESDFHEYNHKISVRPTIPYLAYEIIKDGISDFYNSMGLNFKQP